MTKVVRTVVINEKLEVTNGNIRFVDEIREMMKKYNIMIVMRNEGYGLIPFGLLSTHQLSEATLENELDKYKNTREFTIVPAHSDNYVDVAKVELEYIPDDIDFLMKEQKRIINEKKQSAEDKISDIKDSLEYDISKLEKSFDEAIEQVKKEIK